MIERLIDSVIIIGHLNGKDFDPKQHGFFQVPYFI